MGFLKLVANIANCNISFKNPVFQLLLKGEKIWQQWAFLSQMAKISELSNAVTLRLDIGSQCIQVPTTPALISIVPGPHGGLISVTAGPESIQSAC